MRVQMKKMQDLTSMIVMMNIFLLPIFFPKKIKPPNKLRQENKISDLPGKYDKKN